MKDFAAFALLLALTAGAAPASAADAVGFRCTNPASGANRVIKVDYRRNLVNSFPAEISERWISRHDAAQGGYYDLDRKSGDLTVRYGSSTGGYFLYDKCHAD
jgi:hypothetical protein